jgi:hypothetical protein
MTVLAGVLNILERQFLDPNGVVPPRASEA